jgi:hypothetical protein
LIYLMNTMPAHMDPSLRDSCHCHTSRARLPPPFWIRAMNNRPALDCSLPHGSPSLTPAPCSVLPPFWISVIFHPAHPRSRPMGLRASSSSPRRRRPRTYPLRCSFTLRVHWSEDSGARRFAHATAFLTQCVNVRIFLNVLCHRGAKKKTDTLYFVLVTIKMYQFYT